ncbi:MAG TPA: DUF6266 family protein [Puia sp.]|nr:DUF6266 family protein [Puia sp.]
MGKLLNGLYGPITGKIGPLVGSTWKGIPYVKSAPKRRSEKVSAPESANRIKFAQAHQWLKPLSEFVRAGFKEYSPTVEGFLAAKSWLLRNAFEGLPPDRLINPALVRVSYGSLPLSADISVEKRNGVELQFSWNAGHVEGSNPKDQAMLLAYDIEHGFAYYSLTGQFRETGIDTLKLPTDQGRSYHIYFAFAAHDRSRQSNSVYLGNIRV